MSGPELGVLERIPLKALWNGEATDFTPWLAKNLDKLGNQIGMELELEGIEVSAGDFSADIVAKEIATNKKIIIENQFGSTDHRHLGQIITYASILNASVIIWIAEKLRPEHKSAIDFLNSNFKESLLFYALEASVVRIEQSKPAFLLDLVSEPVQQIAGGAAISPTVSETREKYRQYFQSLIDELREKHKFTNARAAQPQNWYSFASENSHFFKYGMNFASGKKVRTEVYIDCGDKEQNESIFDCLLAQKTEIEDKIGAPLNWEKLENKRACRIAIYRDGDIDSDTDAIFQIRKWSIENLLRFKAIFPNYIISCTVQLAKPTFVALADVSDLPIGDMP